MTLFKRNERVLRGNNAPCPYCSTTAVRFYEAWCDEDKRCVRIEQNYITKGVPINGSVSYAHVHSCYRKRLRSHFPKDENGNYVYVENKDDPFTTLPNVPAVQEPPKPVTGDLFANAMEAFLGSTVEKIARDTAQNCIRETSFPTKTVVVRDNIQREIPGNTHKQLADVILAAQSRHVLMVGMAGTGKSRIAQDVARALDLRYFSISLTSMTPVSAITGMVRAEDITKPAFRQAWEHGGLFNFDEMDHGHPNIVGVVNEALSNGVMAFPDGMIHKHDDFKVTATANTYGRGADRQYVGANQLDAATIDRFATITIDVDEGLESTVAYGTGADNQTVENTLELVRRCRRNALTNGLRFLATPRATFGICEHVRDGMSWDLAVEINLRKGATDDMWTKLTA
jgi:cobaltochelatase CobS